MRLRDADARGYLTLGEIIDEAQLEDRLLALWECAERWADGLVEIDSFETGILGAEALAERAAAYSPLAWGASSAVGE